MRCAREHFSCRGATAGRGGSKETTGCWGVAATVAAVGPLVPVGGDEEEYKVVPGDDDDKDPDGLLAGVAGVAGGIGE